MNRGTKVHEIEKLIVLFYIGGGLYNIIELLWRGFTHPSMFIVGGICFLIIGGINEYLPWEMCLFEQCCRGALAVTLVELVSGIILNLWLGLGVWNYAMIPGNIFGQICLPFSFAWLVLSGLGIVFDDWLRYWLFGEERPHYTLF